ncbi:hypothetical protein BV20DRAFT_961194 [Pilatotrama ljubarskyi]|nr:hypothetical protein BV20DRAFT_961194 [Pilatotrama ljubarskyi]
MISSIPVIASSVIPPIVSSVLPAVVSPVSASAIVLFVPPIVVPSVWATPIPLASARRAP